MDKPLYSDSVFCCTRRSAVDICVGDPCRLRCCSHTAPVSKPVHPLQETTDVTHLCTLECHNKGTLYLFFCKYSIYCSRIPNTFTKACTYY